MSYTLKPISFREAYILFSSVPNYSLKDVLNKKEYVFAEDEVVGAHSIEAFRKLRNKPAKIIFYRKGGYFGHIIWSGDDGVPTGENWNLWQLVRRTVPIRYAFSSPALGCVLFLIVMFSLRTAFMNLWIPDFGMIDSYITTGCGEDCVKKVFNAATMMYIFSIAFVAPPVIFALYYFVFSNFTKMWNIRSAAKIESAAMFFVFAIIFFTAINDSKDVFAKVPKIQHKISQLVEARKMARDVASPSENR
jgi:hypothetical protein